MATLAAPPIADAGDPPAPAAPPSRRARIVVALAIGLASVAFLMLRHAIYAWPGDFDQAWFGARALWSGQNPYDLVGPGRAFDWPWPLYYPATALLVVSPLAIFPVAIARALFVGISSALLAYGITRESWARVPIFGSATFIYAVGASQWDPLLVAAICIPSLAAVVSVKPNIGVVIVARDPSPRIIWYAAAGSAALVALSFILLPSWLGDWLAIVRGAEHFTLPIWHRGGLLLLLALFRWRRPEARLLLLLALVPHNMVLYATLPLFLVPATFRESLVLAALSSAALIFISLFVTGNPQSVAENYQQGDAYVALAYLPCLIMILRRPNSAAGTLTHATGAT